MQMAFLAYCCCFYISFFLYLKNIPCFIFKTLYIFTIPFIFYKIFKMEAMEMENIKELDALANSSFQTTSLEIESSKFIENKNNIVDNIQEAQLIKNDDNEDIPMLEHNDNDDKNIETNLETNNTTNNNSISVIGLEHINSPRKSIQNILSQPIDNSPRLVIEKLVLTNFKSYAGRQEIGPFHPSFSAVVGPNGSGKSNVIDSLLFVFGFRASKMRQSKLKELIHNSEHFPDLQFCQVDIYFKKIIDNYDSFGNNTNNPTVIENSNLIVSRKANKNNSSVYYINNKVSSYTEVTSLLKNEGIDLDHKRFLILQGEVEMIAQMKPKAENENDDGLLEYLEDIIGTSAYKEEIESTTSKIESMQDSFNEKEKVFKYITKEFEEIERQKDSALEYLKLEKKLKDETAKYYYLTNHSEKVSLDKYENKLKELNDKIKDDKEIIGKSKSILNNLSNQKSKLASTLGTINEEISDLKKKFRILEKEEVSLNENLKITQKKTDNISKTLNTNKKSLKTSKNELETLTENIKKHDDDLISLNKELIIENEKLDQIKSSLSSETKKFSDEIQKLHKKLEPWKNNIDEKQSELNIENSQIELLKNQLNIFKSETDTLKSNLNSKKELIKINNSKISSLNDKTSTYQSNIEKNKKTFEYAGKELKKLESELKEISDKVAYAKNKVSNVETQNKVLSALTRLQETGRINGFYGKLGDLGVIDDKYDVAISTGGGALSDYVVDTVEDAQNCIQYLRQNNLGFGKFIVLEKLRKFNMNKINTPENVPRLFDLITPADPKFLPAFYSSMYDTLVAPNLSVANRVAFGGSRRWRVVTLDGKLVDVSGTMSGGGTRVSKGAMKLASNSASQSDTVSPQQLNNWRDELQKKEENFRNAEMAYRKMDQVLRGSEEELPRMSSEILKLKMDNDNLIEEIKEHEKSLNDLLANKKQIKTLESEIENHLKVVEKLTEEKKNLEDNSKDIQNKIDDLQNKILEIGGLKLKTQTYKVQSLKDSIQLKTEMKENDELKIAKLQNKNQKLEKSIESSEHQLKELEESFLVLKNKCQKKAVDIEKLQHEIDNVNNKKSDLTNEIIEIDDKLEDEDAKLREKSDLISDNLKQISKVENMIQKLRSSIEDISYALSNIEYRDVTPYLTWMDNDDSERDLLIQVPINYDEIFTENELKDIDLKRLGEKVDSMKVELGDITVNLDILISFGEKKAQFEDQKENLVIAAKELAGAKERSEELNERRHSEFKAGFTEISSTLKVMYYLITAGGMAELEYFDSHDAFAEGIVFSVMPPKKSWRTISNLSGGEKTLASLALVFALHHYKPTPLYVMDEIDAALDFKNVSIVANYIKSRTKNAQFIVISLRNNMFELAESLVGIYKVNNMTRSATLVNKDLIK